MSSAPQAGSSHSRYQGRGGWGGGALWDSIRYLFGVLVAFVRRRMQSRRIKAELQRVTAERVSVLRELGKVALYLDGFEHPVVEHHRPDLERLEDRKSSLEARLEQRKRDAEKTQEADAVRTEELRQAVVETRRRRREIQDRFDDLVGARENLEAKIAKVQFDVTFHRKAIDKAESRLRELQHADAPPAEIRKVRGAISKARQALDKATKALPRLESALGDTDRDLDVVAGELEAAKEKEREALDLFDAFVEQRDARTWEGHKEQRRIEDELVGIEGEFDKLFEDVGRDLFANRPDHPGLTGRYDRLTDLDHRREELEVAALALAGGGAGMDWLPLFRVLVWLTGLVLLVVLIIRLVYIIV